MKKIKQWGFGNLQYLPLWGLLLFTKNKKYFNYCGH